MPSNPSTNHKRRDTLELKGSQDIATDEQIRRHKPELFEAEFYLKQIQEALKQFTQFSSKNSLKSRLEPEDQECLDSYLSHLLLTIQYQLTQIPFEFNVEQAPSESEEEDPICREHKIVTTVKNADELLAPIKQSIRDIEKLHNLSSLLAQLESYIERAKGSLPNFREHSRRHEVEVETLKGELKDLEEQEKEGGLNRAEKIQKEQLEKEIGEHRQDIARNSKKLNKRKKQITRQQQNITQIIQTLTEFLSQFDPNNPESLPESLNPHAFASDNIQFASLSIKPDLQRILQEKREGEYTAYHSSVERKRLMKEWIPRLAVILALAGGAYAARDHIADVFSGPKIDPNGFGWDSDIMPPTDPELVEQLEANNPEIAYYKVRLLQSTIKISKKQRQAIIEAKDMPELGEAFWPLIHWDIKQEGDDFVVAFSPDKIALMKAYNHVEGDYLSTGYTIDDVEEAEPFGTLNGSFVIAKDVFCHPDFKLFFKLWMKGDFWMTISSWPLDSRQKSMCRKNPRISPDSEKNSELVNLKEKILNHPLFVRYITIEDKLELAGLTNEKDIIFFSTYIIRKSKGSIKPGTIKLDVQLGPNDFKLLKDLFGEDVLSKFSNTNPEIKPFVDRIFKNPFFSHFLNDSRLIVLASLGSLYDLKKELTRHTPVLNTIPSAEDPETYVITVNPEAAEALRAVFGDKVFFSLTRMMGGSVNEEAMMYGQGDEGYLDKLQVTMTKIEYCTSGNSPVLVIMTPTGEPNKFMPEFFPTKPEETLRQLCTITLKAVTPNGEPLEEGDYQELIDSIEVGKPRKISK